MLAGAYTFLPKVYSVSELNVKGLLDILTKQERQAKIHVVYVTSYKAENFSEILLYNYGEYTLKISNVLADGFQKPYNVSVYSDDAQAFITTQMIPSKSLFRIIVLDGNVDMLSLVFEGGISKDFSINQ